MIPIEKPTLTFELKATTVIHRNITIAAYHPDAIQNVLNSASGLFAIQVVGAATSLDQLKYLCQVFPSMASRMQSGNYNTALIQKIICTAAGGNNIPSIDQIKNLTVELSTRIWTIQAIGAVEGSSGVKKLYQLINPRAASAIGLLGNVVKKDMRTAATVAGKVAHFCKPAQANLTIVPQSYFAPAFNMVLPFIPKTRTWTIFRNESKKPLEV